MAWLKWSSILIVLVASLAHAYYDPYGGYRSYSRYGSSEQNQVISLDFNQRDILNSSFRIAAREDRLTDMQTDLLQGANLNGIDDEGQTALMYTSRNCTVSTASFLIRHGADPNVQDKLGRTALMYAAMESCLPVARMLIKNHRTSLMVEDGSRRSAWSYADDAASLDVGGAASSIKRLLHFAIWSHRREQIQSSRTR